MFLNEQLKAEHIPTATWSGQSEDEGIWALAMLTAYSDKVGLHVHVFHICKIAP